MNLGDCGCVPVLRKLLEDAKRERDEALKQVERWEKIASGYEILFPPVGGKRILKLARRDGWACAYCGKETSLTGRDGPKATVDHVIPKCKGGLDHISNCVIACDPCNNAKGMAEWVYGDCC